MTENFLDPGFKVTITFAPERARDLHEAIIRAKNYGSIPAHLNPAIPMWDVKFEGKLSVPSIELLTEIEKLVRGIEVKSSDVTGSVPAQEVSQS